jgi:hypothetical protein
MLSHGAISLVLEHAFVRTIWKVAIIAWFSPK